MPGEGVCPGVSLPSGMFARDRGVCPGGGGGWQQNDRQV